VPDQGQVGKCLLFCQGFLKVVLAHSRAGRPQRPRERRWRAWSC
jgi:hypothetical protein